MIKEPWPAIGVWWMKDHYGFAVFFFAPKFAGIMILFGSLTIAIGVGEKNG